MFSLIALYPEKCTAAILSTGFYNIVKFAI